VMRAGATVVGLALTAAGFVKGRLSISLQRRVEQPGLIS
jgi:hypothetical protein